MITTNLLYHATYPDAEDSIDDNGLLSGVNGCVSLCTFPHHAAGFINMFGCSRIIGVRHLDAWDTYKRIPDDVFITEIFQSILVYAIDTSMIDYQNVSMNAFDKSQVLRGVLPAFMQSYEYRGSIRPDALVEKYWFPKDDKHIDSCFHYLGR